MTHLVRITIVEDTVLVGNPPNTPTTQKRIQLDFSNDRHHRSKPIKGSALDIIDQLSALVYQLRDDKELM